MVLGDIRFTSIVFRHISKFYKEQNIYSKAVFRIEVMIGNLCVVGVVIMIVI